MAHSTTRRGFTVGLSAIGFGLAAPAIALNAKFKLRYGTAFPADHPGTTRITEAAKAIAAETNGAVDLQVYPNSQLGSEPDMFTQTRTGALDFMSTSGANQTVVPVGGINALGAAPTAINFGELYAALQTHVVDGQENPLALIDSAKLYEVQKYIALSGHIWDGHYIFANQKKLAALPAELRASIEKNLGEAALRQRDDIATLNENLTTKLAGLGAVMSRHDKAPFRDTLKSAGFYTEWRGKFGEEAWTQLEKYTGALT